MILVPILILLAMVIAKFQKGVFASFLVLVATKSIMDAFWDVQFGPLSILSIQGVLIPILFYKIIQERKIIPKAWMRTAKIYTIALSFGLIWALILRPIKGIEGIVLNINIYLGFILIPLLIKNQKELKQLLLAIMIGGIFPVAVSIFQLQTGIIFKERETVGLIRYVGFYHDAFPVRFYGLFTLISILIYQSVFKVNGIFLKFFLIIMAGGALLSVYAVFSKAGVGIVGLWVVLLLIFSESRIKQSFSIVVGLLVIVLVFGDAVSSNIEQLFSKEVGYQSGEVTDARYTLAGRGYIWESYWNFWINKQNVFFQWVGDGLSRPVHNELLRILMANGIIGVLFVLIFVITQIKNSFKIAKHVRVFGLMLFGMYLIDCLGLVPGEYYYYNILVWGIFGTLLMKPQLFVKQNKI